MAILTRRILALALALAAPWGAGPARAESVFAVGGLGEPALPEDARIRALGGAGAAEHGANEFSYVNPASIAGAAHLTLQATLVNSVRETRTTLYGDESAFDSEFPSIRLLMRLPGKVVLAGSYVLGTDADFAIARAESAGAASLLTIEGGGGIQFARATLARAIGHGVNAGVDYEIIGGGYSEIWLRQFPSPNLTATRDTLDISWDRKGRFRLGLNYVSPKGWAAGGVYQTPVSLAMTMTQTTPGAATQSTGKTFHVPAGYTLGFSVPAGKLKRFVGQYQRVLWEPSSLLSDLVSFHPAERYSVGFERRVAPITGPSLLSKVPIRIGWTYLRWPDLLPVAGASDVSGGTAGVTEWAASLGTGALTPDKGGAIDFCLEYGQRGDIDQLGASETFLRFAVSVQVTDETWK